MDVITPLVETFSVSKTSTLSQEHPFAESKMNAVTRVQLTFQMFTLLPKMSMLGLKLIRVSRKYWD